MSGSSNSCTSAQVSSPSVSHSPPIANGKARLVSDASMANCGNDITGSEVIKIGNITGRIKFNILGERKRLIQFTPFLDYNQLEEGAEVEFPATLVLINSIIHNPSQKRSDFWIVYGGLGDQMLCVLEDQVVQSQNLVKEKPHEFYYVGRLKGRTIVYEHKDSFYKSRSTNTVAVQKGKNMQQYEAIKKPQSLLKINSRYSKKKSNKNGSAQNEEILNREKWNNKAQYLLSCVAFAIGLGNVWRFPWLAQKYGGGAFLIAYCLCFCFVGLPMFVLEVSIGQRMQRGPLLVWAAMNPAACGIGIACMIVAFVNSVYYSVVVSWCLFYSLKSFGYPAPWYDCSELRNKEGPLAECENWGSVRYFWYRNTLDISPAIDEDVSFNFKISATLVFAWTIIFLSLNKGIRRSGRLSYFTALFPYFVLAIFLIRGFTLDGFENGLKRMFSPNMSKLWDPTLWLEASAQIVFSLSIGFGGYMAFSSYMPLDNNCYFDCILIGLINCATSIMVSIVVFCVLGFRATKQYEDCLFRKQLDNVTAIPTECELNKFLDNAAQGTGIAFIAFTEAMNSFGSISPLFAALFFLMLVTLGIGSMFGTLQGILTSLYDVFLKGTITPKMVSITTCLTSLALSQIFSLTNGEYFMQIFDKYAVTLPLLIITFSELLAVNWYWGMKRVADDIHLMCGKRPSFFFLLCWRYITPTLMFILFLGSVISVIHEGGESYFRWDGELGESVKHILPLWAQFLCGIVAALSTLSIPVILIATKLGCCKIEFNFVEEDFVSDHALHKLRHKHNVEFYTPNRLERWILLMKSEANETSGSANNAFRYPPTRQVSSTDQPGKIEDGYDSANELTIVHF
ncbi:sodium-dependent neutral amino acid transporter B(0)AT3-like isoform X2 [Convolutriloba macropyga]|uniref:sodium-dependent neutral amino acid transporter B(0)AT3-like isoform X2 n=1 Tax=Convolutriloba macropyga TaxID=536237 RepID=UPI003F51EE0F